MKTNEKIYYDGQTLTFAKGLVEAGFTMEDSQRLLEFSDQYRELMKILENPAVPVQKKKNIVDKIFPSSTLGTCLKYMIDQNLVPYIVEIMAATFDVHFEQSNVVLATITYAKTKPSQEQLNYMEKELLPLFEKEAIQWTFVEDPQLADGFTLEINGRFYDYSLNGKINKLLDHLNRR